jgi:hypothetical protein
MTPTTTHQLEKAIDAALDELNQVTFMGAPRLAVLSPCRGNAHLTGFALRHMAARVKKDGSYDTGTMVTYCLQLGTELGKGLPPNQVQGLQQEAATLVDNIVGWVKLFDKERHWAKGLHHLRQQYSLPTPASPTPPAERPQAGARWAGFLDPIRD